MKSKGKRHVLGAVLLAGMMAVSAGTTVVWANNCKDEYVQMHFDETVGNYVNHTRGREKQDYSSSYIKRSYSSNGQSFRATLVAAGGENSKVYYDNFKLVSYDIDLGEERWMRNYVKESGYNAAAVRCESNYGAAYTIKFKWSPDSV